MFHQSVFSVATGRVAAEIETRIVSINYKTNKRTPIPAAYRKEVWYGMVEYGIIKPTNLIDWMRAHWSLLFVAMVCTFCDEINDYLKIKFSY